MEELYGVRHEVAVGRSLDALFDGQMVGMIRGSATGAPEGVAYYRIPLATRHSPPRRLLVNLGATPLRDAAATSSAPS